MVDTLILDIKQAMSSTLTNGQMEKLHKVLAHYLYDLEITKKEGAEKEEKQNIESFVGLVEPLMEEEKKRIIAFKKSSNLQI